MSERLDKLLVERGFAASRTQAQRMIAAGSVSGKLKGLWQTLDKPSVKLDLATELRAAPIAEHQYVSRAGLKLAAALQQLCERNLLAAPVQNCAAGVTALDIGQSTGGFTDCLLQHGATHVLGVDVGHGQLDKRLQDHPHITAWEGINARNLPVAELLEQAEGGFDWVVMDVSFISQTLILPHVAAVLKAGGRLISLVKPQFEVGPQGVGKGGLVKNQQLLDWTGEHIQGHLQQHGLRTLAYFESAIQGSDGNREFFAVAEKP